MYIYIYLIYLENNRVPHVSDRPSRWKQRSSGFSDCELLLLETPKLNAVAYLLFKDVLTDPATSLVFLQWLEIVCSELLDQKLGWNLQEKTC